MAQDAPSVTFTTQAFKSGGKFLFSLLEVENLPYLDETGETETYFRIRVAGNPTRRTATMQNSCRPCQGEGSDFVFTGGVGTIIEIIAMDWNPQGDDDDLVKASVELTDEMLSGEEQVALLEVQQETGREEAEGRRAGAEAFNNPIVTSGTVEFGQGDYSAQMRRGGGRGRGGHALAKINAWAKTPKRTTYTVKDGRGRAVGTLDLEASLDKAVADLRAGNHLVKYNNGRGALSNRNRNDVMLPSSPNHNTFYEFDMVDANQHTVLVDGHRHGFRLVIDVDGHNKPQVAWASTVHYGVGRNQNKQGWRLVRGVGLIG